MKKLILTILVIIACLFALSACDDGGEPEVTTNAPDVTTQTEAHVCEFGEWQVRTEATCTEAGWLERTCACGENLGSTSRLQDSFLHGL